MEKKILKEPHFVEEVLALFRSGMPKEQLLDELSNYHENDIAGAIEQLIPEERKAIYPVLGPELISEIFAYIEDPDIYLAELNIENAAENKRTTTQNNSVHTWLVISKSNGTHKPKNYMDTQI